MKARSISDITIEGLKTKVEQNISDDFNPTLAIIFLSVEQDRKLICDYLNKKGIDIFGCTTAGEFIDGNICSGSTTMLLLEIDKSLYHIMIKNYINEDPREIAKRMGKKSFDFFNNPAFITVSSGFYLDGEKVIRGLEDACGKDISIWGGKAGDDQKGENTFVFSNNHSSPHGIAILVIDNDKITIKGQAESGWKAVGTPKTVTDSEGLWIYKLDDQPALDVMIKYMGYKFKNDDGTDIMYDAKVTSPVLLLREKGEPILRSQTFMNWSDRSIMLSGNFEENAKIKFTLPPDFEVIDEVIDSSRDFMRKEEIDAEALIMFSCSGRLTELGPLIGQEIEGIKNTFAAPMVGFFTYGEYGRAKNGDNEYHNYTCCWVALSEIN